MFFDLLKPPEIFVHLALVSYVLGFLVRGELMLRALILAGSGFYIIYYYTVADVPLWEAIFGTVAIIAANIYSSIRIIKERSTVGMNQEHLQTYQAFNTLRPGEFRRLMKHSTKRIYDQDTVLFERGAELDKLYFIQDGIVCIERDGRQSEIGAGDFIGELAFVRGTPTSASVMAKKYAVLLEFNSVDVQQLMNKSSSMSNAIIALFNRDMATKLAVSWPDKSEAAPDPGQQLQENKS